MEKSFYLVIEKSNGFWYTKRDNGCMVAGAFGDETIYRRKSFAVRASERMRMKYQKPIYVIELRDGESYGSDYYDKYVNDPCRVIHKAENKV